MPQVGQVSPVQLLCQCFELLLPLTSDVDVRTVQGVDADVTNYTACSFGQHSLVKTLLRRGA